MCDRSDNSDVTRSSYQFNSETQAAIRNGAIAVLYDNFNGINTRQFYFSPDEVSEAEEQYKDSEQYSVEYFEKI